MSVALSEEPATLPAIPSKPVPADGKPRIRFKPTEGFQRDLKGRVEAYFESNKLSPRDSGRMYLKTAIIMLWWAVSWTGLVFFSPSLGIALLWALSLGLAVAGIGFNIQHDGGHQAYSDRKSINRIMAATMDFAGASSYIWNHKHNVLHHTYTNIEGHDDDVEVGYLGRLAPHQPRLWFHRFQHFYLWFLYGFLAPKWHYVDDPYNAVVGKVGAFKFPRPKGWDLVQFIGGKLVFTSWALIIPMLVGHSVGTVLGFYFICCFIQGLTMAVVFQLAHTVEDAEFPTPDPETLKMENEWAIHQIRTTVDFSRNSKAVTWYLGGLNFQVVHHLFPKVCHIHYPALSKIVEETCAEYGIKYNLHPSLFDGVASHYRHLRNMGMGLNGAPA